MRAGCWTGILSVVAIIIVNDLARGSGRFNFMQGVLFVCMSLGPSLGNLLGGLVANYAGFNGAFLSLGAIGGTALAAFALFMPETRPR